ncbi:MAG: hypothetical protein ACRDBQ_13675, partial [Shewanella sp.]
EVQEAQEYKKQSNDALLDELNAKASLYRIEIQECQAAIAEYNMLQTNFPALEITIDNALRNTSQKYRDLRGRLAAVEKVMRALESNESAR